MASASPAKRDEDLGLVRGNLPDDTRCGWQAAGGEMCNREKMKPGGNWGWSITRPVIRGKDCRPATSVS